MGDADRASANFRTLTRSEGLLLGQLLAADFPGSKELAAQAREMRVRKIDSNGSLALKPSDSEPRAEVRRRIPVEARLRDQDGMTINILLHVLDGRLNELEIYRDDIEEVERDIDPEELEILLP